MYRCDGHSNNNQNTKAKMAGKIEIDRCCSLLQVAVQPFFYNLAYTERYKNLKYSDIAEMSSSNRVWVF